MDADYDLSNTTFINTLWYIREPDYVVIRVALFLPVVVLGLFGNSLAIYVIWRNVNMRTPTNLLIGNMAAADLLSLLIHPWVFLTYDIYQNYPLGFVGCRFEGALECAILITSVISMSVVTYDRLTAIVLPKETRLNKRNAKIVMGTTWIIGILISIPLILCRHYKERQWKDFKEKYCNENTELLNLYWYVIITVLVWIPLSIQIICYFSIFITLNKYEKEYAIKFQYYRVDYKKKAAKMMFMVTITFMICHLPFTALIIYRHQLLKSNAIASTNNVDFKNQVDGTYHTLWFTSKYLIFLNGALNPIIYGLTNEKFRRALKNTKLGQCFITQPKKTQKTVKIRENKEKQKEDVSRNRVFFIFKRRDASDKILTAVQTPVETGTKVLTTRL